MDAEAFGLSRNPFQRSPELDEACLPNTVASMLAELQSSLRSPQGVSVLVADGGAGKTMAASAFARRLGAGVQVAVLTRPISSGRAIARDALTLFGAEGNTQGEGDPVADLKDHARRRALAGKSTVLILDDAHRLSPQSLEDLAQLFDDDEPARLYLFLFGRPRLLDRMHAGPEKALHAHLLQVGRLESLTLRECVRYLERRVALCGGELGALFHEGAIDELVRVSAGRLVHLERNALAALERAAKRRAPRVLAEDVRPVARAADDDEEDGMAGRQQALRFELPETVDDDSSWQAGDDLDDKWGDDDAGHDSASWHAGEDDGPGDAFDDDALDWAEDDEAGEDAAFAAPAAAVQGLARRRLAGRAVLSAAACLGLVWAANRLPGPAQESSRGRDVTLVAERLSSRPEDILRLPRTVEAADADAQVQAWLVQPRSVAKAEAPAVVAEAVAAAQVQGPEARVADRAAVVPGPGTPVARTEVASVPSAAPAQPVRAATRVASAPVAKAPARALAKVPSGPVFTVQLGAFKARSNAEQFATRLRGKSPRIVREGGLYRVMSGSFTSKREATVHEASLKRAGYTTYVRTAVF